MQKLQETSRTCKKCQEKKALTKENFQKRRFKNRAGQPVIYYSRVCVACWKEEFKSYSYQKDYDKETRNPEYKYKCVYEPEYTGFLGKYIGFDHMRQTLLDGYMPPGSQWYREVDGVTYVVRGNEGLSSEDPPDKFVRQRLESIRSG